MSTITDLKLRESRPERAEIFGADLQLTWPTFSYWVKAGIAFTLGAWIVMGTAAILYGLLWLGLLANYLSRHVR